MATFQSSGKTPIDIGSRLELMIDDYLIARLEWWRGVASQST